MKKRIISAVLSAVVCISALPLQMVSFADDTYCPFTGGSGTSADPYQIASSYDLQILSELVADSDEATAEQYSQAYYVQTKDIELKNVSFVPIGTHPGIGFSGSYDGNYYTISNLDIDTTGSYIGLFGWVNGGSIENLSVYGNVATTETDSGVALIGGIAGEICDGASVTNCSFNGTVTTDGTNAGGVVGQIARSGSVVQCYFNGTVTGSNRVGGVAGYVSDQNKAGELKMISCYAAGKVIDSADEVKVGGVASDFVSGNAESVITVKNNYYLSTACEGAVNGGTYDGCSKLSADLLKGAADLLGTPYVNNNEGDTVNDGYPIFEWQSTPYEFKGAGTADDPYQISSKEELTIMRDLINSKYSSGKYNACYYVQTADIDLENMTWEPIGVRLKNGESAPMFSGSYNGQGYSINNLYVNREEKFAGLFGSFNGNGVIENLIVYGEVNSTGPSAGGICGELCYGITEENKSGTPGTIRNCAFIGNVTGSEYAVGGVVGYSWQTSTIENCYHIGDVTNITNNSAGGIVGKITVGEDVSGDANVRNCYHAGTITSGEGATGGVVGHSEERNKFVGSVYISNCYYLKDSAAVGANGTSTECETTALTSNLLKNAYLDLGSAYAKNPDADFNDGYPIFQFQLYEGLSGDVNSDGKFNVADIVMMQKWLLCAGDLTDWKAGDLCKDDRIDVFDLCLMKRLLINMGGGVNYTLSLNKTSASLDLEGNASTLQLEATVQPEGTKIIWGSSNTSVATVSDNGLVKAVGAGTAVITAKTAIGGRTASCRITVADPSIKLDKSSVDLYIGGTATLSTTVVPTGSAVTWKSADTSIATVSGGKITAVAAGNTTVTASITVNGKSYTASCTVKVTKPSITLNNSTLSLYIAGTSTLTATTVPSGQTVTWKSDNESVATVSGGKVTAVAAGTANITATITVNGKNYSATCKVTVTKPTISLNNSTLSLYVAGTSTLTASTVPSGQTVTWKSDNTSVATVSGGKVTAVAAGTANITASITVNGKTYTSAACKVTVTKPTITISKSSLSMFIGDTSTLTATINPTGQTITWKSSNTGVATVNSSGKITAVAAGTANITASITVNGKTYTSSACAVTVKTPAVTWSKTSDSSSDDHVYYSGGNFYAYVYALPSYSTNVSGGSVALSVVSGNATVSGGKLYINQPGTIKVRATLTYQGKTYTSDFTYTRTVTFYAGNAFNMRSGQGTSYSSVGSIPKGVSLTVSELGYSDSKYVWGKVTYNGTTGWVALWLKDRSESNGIITV